MIDKSRISLDRSLNVNYIKISNEEGEEVDNLALKIIERDTPEFLLHITSLNINNITELRYDMGNGMSLRHRNFQLNKDDFLRFYRSILQPFMDCADWFLDYHYFCIDEDYIFLDKNNIDVKYIYIPLSNFKNSDKEIVEFLKNILDKVTVSNGSEFLVKLYQAFSRGNILIRDVYEMVEEEQNLKKALQPSLSKNIEHSGENIKVSAINYMNSLEPVSLVDSTKKEEAKVEENKREEGFNGITEKKGRKTEQKTSEVVKKEVSKSDIGDYKSKALSYLDFGDEKKKEKKVKTEKTTAKKKKEGNGFFGLFKKNKVKAISSEVGVLQGQSVEGNYELNSNLIVQKNLNNEQNYDYTEIDGDEDYTEIEEVHNVSSQKYLTCVEPIPSGAPKIMDLNFNKSKIIIGRSSSERTQPDVIFDSSNKKIGRMHACIEREGEVFYITDLGSANGTKLNGEVLIPNKQYPLKAGDVVGFIIACPIKYKVVM